MTNVHDPENVNESALRTLGNRRHACQGRPGPSNRFLSPVISQSPARKSEEDEAVRVDQGWRSGQLPGMTYPARPSCRVGMAGSHVPTHDTLHASFSGTNR